MSQRSSNRRTDDLGAPVEEGFSAVADVAPHPILVVQDGELAYANVATAQLFGYDHPVELLAQPFASLFLPEEVEDARARIAALYAPDAPSSQHCEHAALRRDGSVFSLELSSTLIQFRGRPAVLSFGYDLTDRKRLEAKLLDSDRLAAVGVLAAGVAHEVNNPLTYVLLNLRRLRRTLPDLIGTESERELCERLLDEALDGSERVRLIVKDLLELGRPQATDVGPTQVTNVVESAVKLANTALRRRALVIRHYYPAPPVLANDTRLGQVLLNLLINAGQAFATDDLRRNEIHITVGPRGKDRVVIEVADNGTGIPPAHAERVFDPFFTTKPVGMGVGLGLPIARSIVSELHGELTMVPSDSGGLFRIELPCAETAEATQPQGRVLVVDDNGPLAHQLDVIVARGCEVIALADAKRALALAEEPPGLAAICCDLDRAAGHTLFSEASETRPAMIKRLVALASPTSAARKDAEAQGTTVLIRPLTPRQLDAALAALL